MESGWQQAVLFDDIAVPQALPFDRRRSPEALLLLATASSSYAFRLRPSAANWAEMLWAQHKTSLPYPKSAIPVGIRQTSAQASLQLLARDVRAASVAGAFNAAAGIMAEPDEKLQEMLLCASPTRIEG